jgi:predicted secreted Zn-dependent protease
MVELNNEQSEIIVKEVFSFNNEVFPKIEEIKTDLTVLLEEGRAMEEDVSSINDFINYEITKQDEIEILSLIKESYEQDIYSFDFNSSIFDENRIYKCLNDWIEGKFYFLVGYYF